MAAQSDSNVTKVKNTLLQQGIDISSVRINNTQVNFDRKIRIKIDVLNPIKISGMDISAGSVLEYEDEYLSKVKSKNSIKIDKYSCQGGYPIGFQYGKLCRCYLSENVTINGVMNFSKNSDLIFQEEVLAFVKTSSPWNYDNKRYEKGSFNITSKKVIAPIPEEIFHQDLCLNIPNKNRDKAVAVLKKLKIELPSVKVIDAFDTQDLDEDYYYYAGHNIKVLVMNPLLIEDEIYPIGTTLLFVDEVIREIELPKNQTVKLKNQFICSGKIEKHSNGKICSCEINQKALVKGYNVMPPATLYFNKSGFEVFRNFNKQHLNLGFYKINNNGKAEIDPDVEYFHCND